MHSLPHDGPNGYDLRRTQRGYLLTLYDPYGVPRSYGMAKTLDDLDYVER